MTTQEQAQSIVQQLSDMGTQHDYQQTTQWEQAFKLYLQVTGQDLSMNCRGCYHKVYQFLLQHSKQ